MAKRTQPREHKSVFPKCIHNMIQRAYVRGENSAQAAERINSSAIADKLDITLSTAQVAAAYAWITMRETR